MNYRELASKGRYGDTELAHISPQEGRLLRALGSSGTINPETGLSEHFVHDYLFGGGLSDDISGSDLNPSNWSIGGQNIGQGLGNTLQGAGDWLGNSDLNPGNWSVGGQNVGDFLFGGGLSSDIAGSDLNPSNWSVGGQNLGLGNLWDNTLGNQGLGGLLTGANPSVGGYMGENFGTAWDQTYGNQGVGGWLQSLFGGGSSGGPLGAGYGGGGGPGGPQVPGGFNLGKAPQGGGGMGGGRMRTPLGQSPFEKGPLGNIHRGGPPSSSRPMRQRGGY